MHFSKFLTENAPLNHLQFPITEKYKKSRIFEMDERVLDFQWLDSRLTRRRKNSSALSYIARGEFAKQSRAEQSSIVHPPVPFSSLGMQQPGTGSRRWMNRAAVA